MDEVNEAYWKGWNNGYACATSDNAKIDVVRCKDCKHRDPEDHKCDSGALERVGCIFSVADDYFCAWGERRDAND